MKTPLLGVFAAMVIATGSQGAEPGLEVHAGREAYVIEDKAREDIVPLTLRFLESSNFNSRRHREILKATPRGTHAAYRKAVEGRYLVVAFETPRRIRTIGGEVDVLEMVIGLNRSDYADSLFTIDGEGRVVAHAKYSGADGIEILRKVERALPGD